MKFSKFNDIIVNNSEVALDRILEDGLLKDIPIINNLVALYNVKTTISDKIFYKKVVSFHESFASVNRDRFVKWNTWANENIESAEKIASTLVLHIDSQHDLLKCKMVGHIFKKLVEEKIYLNDFEAYAYVISMCSVRDLRKHCVEGGDQSSSTEASLAQRLQFVGFYSFTSESLSQSDKVEYEITDRGCNFIEQMEEFSW
ncbi:hypothetical protein D3C78_875060 [compost metagenome]